ncbi:MAG: lactonase family protein, partial [bacterium]|nr:lactonase family protein [bacterium]
SPVTAEVTGITPRSLVLSDDDSMLLNVCGTEVRSFQILSGGSGFFDAVGVFQPPGASFSQNNNAVISAAGTLAAVADETNNWLHVFDPTLWTVGGPPNTAWLWRTGTDNGPTAVAPAFDFRELVVHAAAANVAQVFNVEALQPSLTQRMGFALPSDIIASDDMEMEPLGDFAHVSSSTGNVQRVDLLTGAMDPRAPAAAGEDVVISEDGSVMAVNTFSTVFIYNSPASSTPSGTFTGGSLSGVHMAISADGRFLYVPDLASEEIFVLDTAAGGAITPSFSVSVAAAGQSGPTWVALSPDGLTLACTGVTSDGVALFDVNSGTGNLTNPRSFTPSDPSVNITQYNNPVLLETGGGVIGSEYSAGQGRLMLFDSV